MNCTICNDTGKRAGSDYLDCGHCGAAAERFVLNDFVSGVRQHNFTSFADLHWHIHQRARQIERQEQAARIAELERHIEGCRAQILKDTATINNLNEARLPSAAPSAPAVEQQPVAYIAQLTKTSHKALTWSNHGGFVGTEYIPLYTAPPAANTDKVREAIDRLPAEIMNLRCTRTMSHFATTDDMKLYKEGHRDARHAAVELVLSAVWGTPSHEAPADWKLVPVSITEDMHVAAVKAIIRSTGNDDCPPNVWKAMLAAAPVASMAVQAPVREVPEPEGWREAMQEFVDRCERGEIISRYTYSKFKALLAPLPAAPVQQEGDRG